jgi:cobyrinic acid a,c-diamide synthase
VLGCVPRLPALQIPERRLGLFTVAERQGAAADFIQEAGELLANYIDLDRLVKIANAASPLPDIPDPETPPPSSHVRLAVAQDEAFCFYYEDNLEELRRCGAEIVPFSPLNDQRLPEGIAGIYFGGGYPELYARQLSENAAMRRQVLVSCRENMPVYAECGGFMYLTEGIHLSEGDFPLVGALPGWCVMGDRLIMGYRTVETLSAGIFGAAGQRLRGHEFHYSQWENFAALQPAFRISPRNSAYPSRPDGFSRGNLHAAYVHLHFGQNPCLAENYVQACREWQKNKNHHKVRI